MGNSISTSRSELPTTLYDRQTFPRQEKKLTLSKSGTLDNRNNRDGDGNQESSRMLFLMYLIHRTWNVVVDGKGKRWVLSLLHLRMQSVTKLVMISRSKKDENEITWFTAIPLWHHHHHHSCLSFHFQFNWTCKSKNNKNSVHFVFLNSIGFFFSLFFQRWRHWQN